MALFEFRGFVVDGPVQGAMFLGFQGTKLIVASGQTGGVATYQTVAGSLPILESETPGLDGFLPSQGQIVDQSLWLWDHLQGRSLIGHQVAVTTSNQALQIDQVQGLANGQFVVALHDQDRLALIAGTADTGFVVLDSVADSAKTTVSASSALMTVTVDGQEYLIAASHTDDGLTSFTTSGGQLAAVDMIGAKDGVWVSGVSALETCQVDGQTYILAASAQANSLVSLRLNPSGVFFKTDQIWDTQDSRFAGAVDLDHFEWHNRDFFVVGGQDSGLSLIEMLPEGTLYHHGAIAQSNAWDLGPITNIAVQVVGNEAQIFVTGTQDAGVAEVVVDLSRTGARIEGSAANDTLSGGWTDDLILGGAGDDLLTGKAGDDTLIDGAGRDTLSGGDGADVFVFHADGQRDQIQDFSLAQDRIDLGAWGQIYDLSDLTITRTDWGAEIAWHDEILDVYSRNHSPIEVTDWGSDHFLFLNRAAS